MIIIKSKYQSNFENNYITELILSFNKNWIVFSSSNFNKLLKLIWLTFLKNEKELVFNVIDPNISFLRFISSPKFL